MTELSHDEIQELLGVYALDAVDEHERDLVTEHIATCVRCRAEVSDHRETAAMLAFAGQDAPDGVWDRIASTLEEPPPPIDLLQRRAALSTQPQPKRKWFSGGIIGAAAAVVISLLALGIAVDDRDDRDGIPDGPRIHLASTDGQHSADIVVAGGQGVVFNDNLPELPESQVYQLWGLRDEQLISLGLLGTDPEQVEFVADDEFELFAITVEKAGGVVKSEQPPVVAGTVDA